MERHRYAPGPTGQWLDPSMSLEQELSLRAARLAVPRLGRADLEARLDSALVHAMTTDHLLSQALARVSELELRELVGQPPAKRRHQWARDLLAGLGVRG